MAWVIINEELDNPRFWQRYVSFVDAEGKPSDFEGYKAFLENYRPEKVAEICRVPVEQIYSAARAFAESSATMSLWCMGINQRVQGVFANNLIHNLHLLTGQICRPGATPFSLTGQPNACGGVRDTGALSHLLPAGRAIPNPKHRAEMEKLWGLPEGRISPNPGYHTVALFEALGRGDVKCMLVWQGGDFWLLLGTVAVPLAALALELVAGKRLWCRFVCPQSVLLGAAAKCLPVKAPGLRIGWQAANCTCKGKAPCQQTCSLELNPRRKGGPERRDCTHCGDCVNTCASYGKALEWRGMGQR